MYEQRHYREWIDPRGLVPTRVWQDESDLLILAPVWDYIRAYSATLLAAAVAHIFDSLARVELNPRVITRSASEINLAFSVPNASIPTAVRALHSLILE